MNHPEIYLNPQSREVTTRGRTNSLVEKNWQVLNLLIEHAPKVVPRNVLIDEIWGGNWTVGDKNLNQAIWSIRRALGDKSRTPVWIRTVPRAGYQWIGSTPIESNIGVALPKSRQRRVMGYLIAATVLLSIGIFSNFDASRVSRIAENAYVVGADVHVEFQDGLLGILRNRTTSNVGVPKLSQDGYWIAIPVGSGKKCRLITVDLNTRERKDYEGCPSETTG